MILVKDKVESTLILNVLTVLTENDWLNVGISHGTC